MAQSQTTVGTKTNTAPNNFIYAAEFNNVNDTVNGNAADAEARLQDLDTRTASVEATSASIQEYTSENLPETAEDGTLAFDLTEQTLVYHKNGEWYKISDDSQIIVLIGFVFNVKTDNTGTSLDDQFTLPLRTGKTYNFTVDWGDGSAPENITSDTPVTHTFLGGIGTYSISITGVIEGFFFDNGGDKEKIVSISDFGTLAYNGDATDAFYGCTNLTITATEGPDTSLATDFLWFYFNCSSLTSVPLMDFSSGTRVFAMFRGCTAITSFPNFDFTPLSSGARFREAFRDMHSITTMDNCTFGSIGDDARLIFRDCRSLTSLPPSLDFSTAVNLSQGFYNCYQITDFPINLSNATILDRAWQNCTSLVTFNSIDVSLGENFANAWNGCTSLVNFPALNLSSGTDFTLAWSGCALNSASVDNVMAALVANGASNLSTSLAGGTTIPFASWSAQAQADHATLISRGWTIVTN